MCDVTLCTSRTATRAADSPSSIDTSGTSVPGVVVDGGDVAARFVVVVRRATVVVVSSTALARAGFAVIEGSVAVRTSPLDWHIDSTATPAITTSTTAAAIAIASRGSNERRSGTAETITGAAPAD